MLDRSRREVDPRAAVHVPRVAAGGVDAWVVLQTHGLTGFNDDGETERSERMVV